MNKGPRTKKSLRVFADAEVSEIQPIVSRVFWREADKLRCASCNRKVFADRASFGLWTRCTCGTVFEVTKEWQARVQSMAEKEAGIRGGNR